MKRYYPEVAGNGPGGPEHGMVESPYGDYCLVDDAEKRITELERTLTDVLAMVNAMRDAEGNLPLGLNTLYERARDVLRKGE